MLRSWWVVVERGDILEDGLHDVCLSGREKNCSSCLTTTFLLSYAIIKILIILLGTLFILVWFVCSIMLCLISVTSTWMSYQRLVHEKTILFRKLLLRSQSTFMFRTQEVLLLLRNLFSVSNPCEEASRSKSWSGVPCRDWLYLGHWRLVWMSLDYNNKKNYLDKGNAHRLITACQRLTTFHLD